VLKIHSDERTVEHRANQRTQEPDDEELHLTGVFPPVLQVVAEKYHHTAVQPDLRRTPGNTRTGALRLMNRTRYQNRHVSKNVSPQQKNVFLSVFFAAAVWTMIHSIKLGSDSYMNSIIYIFLYQAKRLKLFNLFGL
jgi:hypothetical protein